MKHGFITDEVREMAALYALGALSQGEARAFESHLAEGCQICREEIESFESAAGLLGLAAEETDPPARVRGELLARVNGGESQQEDHEAPEIDLRQFVSIRATEGEWDRMAPGIYVKTLYVDERNGIATSLVKMRAGTSLPMHRHNGVEQFYILEGDCNVCGQQLGPGDYHRAPAGSIHEATYTTKGTMFLLVAPTEYNFLEA